MVSDVCSMIVQRGKHRDPCHIHEMWYDLKDCRKWYGKKKHTREKIWQGSDNLSIRFSTCIPFTAEHEWRCLSWKCHNDLPQTTLSSNNFYYIHAFSINLIGWQVTFILQKMFSCLRDLVFTFSTLFQQFASWTLVHQNCVNALCSLACILITAAAML